MDNSDIETIINNQAILMAALLEHLAMAGGRDRSIEALTRRLEELKLRKVHRLETDQQAQRQ